jgi:hypothetical protein
MRTALIHGDGRVFLNMPPHEEILGKDLATPGSLFSRHKQSGLPGTLVSGRALATGEDRMVAMRTVDRADLRMDKPLVVAVSRELSAVYMTWRGKAWRHTAFLAVVLLAMGFGLFFSQRRRQTLQRIAAAAAQERQEGIGGDRKRTFMRGPANPLLG